MEAVTAVVVAILGKPEIGFLSALALKKKHAFSSLASLDSNSSVIQEKPEHSELGFFVASCILRTRRMQTDPAEDYAKGWIPFLDCTIFLDSRPLIPRVETEYWVEQALADISGTKVLDLFAGSGAIGIAVLKHLPGTRVDFGEIHTTHFPTILKNVNENSIDTGRVRVIETDVWSGITDRYDCILANPPYIAQSRRDQVQASVLTHEPEQALFAEEDGFALIRKTIEGAPAHLNPNGILYIEHDPEQSTAITELGKASGFSVETRKDQFGLLRFSVLKAMA